MQRVLASLAGRVDASIHPLLSAREPSADGRTLVIVVTGDKGLCGSFNTNVIKGAGGFVAREPAALLARPGRPQGPRLLRPARVHGAVRAGRHLSEAARSRTRRRSRRRRSRRFTSGQFDRVMLVYNEFKSVMSQRVVVDQLLPIPRAEVEGDAGDADGSTRPAGQPDRLPVRAVRRRRSSTSCCRATSRCRSIARCSSRTRRSSPPR